MNTIKKGETDRPREGKSGGVGAAAQFLGAYALRDACGKGGKSREREVEKGEGESQQIILRKEGSPIARKEDERMVSQKKGRRITRGTIDGLGGGTPKTKHPGGGNSQEGGILEGGVKSTFTCRKRSFVRKGKRKFALPRERAQRTRRRLLLGDYHLRGKGVLGEEGEDAQSANHSNLHVPASQKKTCD